MRRLFFTFANGPPGIGLLLIRLLTGFALVGHHVVALHGSPSLGLELFATSMVGVGLLLVAGFWTPVAGWLVAAGSLWDGFERTNDPCNAVMVGVLGLSLVLLGPGAWSVDARLFGWKRL